MILWTQNKFLYTKVCKSFARGFEIAERGPEIHSASAF
ncbi:argininosuccinate lyase [Alicyclobacillus hesperidum URH17-3-68]|nr:argininosuccinate lyase [Alicyclobacillus hesperidum URH17-3-68]